MKRTVKKIIDGNTFVVNRTIDSTVVSRSIEPTIKIQLASVKATKPDAKATSVLKRLIDGKTVTVVPLDKRGNKIIAEVICNENSVNRIMKEHEY